MSPHRYSSLNYPLHKELATPTKDHHMTDKEVLPHPFTQRGHGGSHHTLTCTHIHIIIQTTYQQLIIIHPELGIWTEHLHLVQALSPYETILIEQLQVGHVPAVQHCTNEHACKI